VLGQTPNELELDKKFWQERQTHRIYCAKSEYTPGYTVVTIFNCRMGMVVNRTEAGFEKWGKYFYTYSPPNIRKMLDIEIEDKRKELIITDKTEAEIIDAIKEKTHDANPRIKELFYARLVEKSKPELLRLFKEAAVISDGMFKGDITLVPAKYWKIKGLED
jgi:hypothetical protein